MASARPPATLGPYLEAVARAVPAGEALARDPVRFPRRYRDPRDVEAAALLAAQLAYGRVDLFGPVIARVLALADARGGPGNFCATFGERDAASLAGVVYRWNRGEDFALLFRTLRTAWERHGSLGALFAPGPAKESLAGAIEALKACAPDETTRGFRTWLASPADGSACKRWLMLMRWMVRRDDVDLGLWAHLSPRDLVIPLDTHVMRLSRFCGLTARNDAGWRTAEEVTAALRALDPGDPVRFDFALAHLGISGACRGFRDPEVCPACPLEAVCVATPRAAPATRAGDARRRPASRTGPRGRA
ncbi:MAG: TIGR02757 family protein [Myxococcota bacterium]